MNKQPVSYLQTDSRWKNADYSAKGESSTIGASGCGPTAMAMVLATWADKNVTPKTECAWALKNGYKAPHQGTYYSYFPPAAKRYGLNCWQQNSTNLYGNSTSKHHDWAKEEILKGNLVIACMGKGTWTSSGHYVLVWWIDGNMIYINDPASTKQIRTRGNYAVFKQQVKYYWVVEKPKNIKDGDDDMTAEEVTKIVNKILADREYNVLHASEPDWSKKEGYWKKATDKGVVDGKEPERPVKRDEMTAILGRLGLLE